MSGGGGQWVVYGPPLMGWPVVGAKERTAMTTEGMNYREAPPKETLVGKLRQYATDALRNAATATTRADIARQTGKAYAYDVSAREAAEYEAETERRIADAAAPVVLITSDTVSGPEYRAMRERCYAAEYERDEARASYSKAAAERAIAQAAAQDRSETLARVAHELAAARKEAAEAVATAERLAVEHQVLTAKAVECGRAFSDGRLAEHQRLGAAAERERLAKVFDATAARFRSQADGYAVEKAYSSAAHLERGASMFEGAAAECRRVPQS